MPASKEPSSVAKPSSQTVSQSQATSPKMAVNEQKVAVNEQKLLRDYVVNHQIFDKVMSCLDNAFITSSIRGQVVIHGKAHFNYGSEYVSVLRTIDMIQDAQSYTIENLNTIKDQIEAMSKFSDVNKAEIKTAVEWIDKAIVQSLALRNTANQQPQDVQRPKMFFLF